MNGKFSNVAESMSFDVLLGSKMFTVVLNVEERTGLNPIGRFLRKKSIRNDVERAIKEKLDGGGQIFNLDILKTPYLGHSFTVLRIYKQ